MTGTDGRRLDFVRRGQGAPLLLIQGMAATHAMWGEELLGALEQHFDVVAYDHRGVGRGDRADGEFTVADLADDAAAVISSVGWTDAHVFGISLGGMVAQELVLRHPAAVRSLVLGCTWAGGDTGVIAETSYRMVEAIASRDLGRGLRVSFEANFSPRYAALPGTRELYRQRALAVRMPVPVVQLQFRAALAHNAADRLPEVAVPTLVLHGTADAGIPVSNGYRLAELIPAARLELFDGAGHLFWWEDPARAAALVVAHATQGDLRDAGGRGG
ncbi:alpha/beta fold hydrolase [Kribbella sp. GL6]|uniref:alpha/beta fold hydrolase n=1 Tax=Kribbella sp. GL6 TaxID=3419765 RepID=UPI003CFFB245